MAAKRRPTSDLNRDNWDQEDAPEERGEYVPLSEEEARKRGRKILKGRRALGERRPEDASGNGKPNPFAGFSGFQKSSTSFGAVAAAATASATPPRTSSPFGQTAAGTDGSKAGAASFDTLTPRSTFSGGVFGAKPTGPTAATGATAEPPVAKPLGSVFGGKPATTAPSGSFSFSAAPTKSSVFGGASAAPGPSIPAKAVADVSKPAGGSSAAFADDKYANVFSVGGTGAPDRDIALSGSVAKRKAYVTAMTRLNEAFLWKVLETTEIAEPVKVLLTRAQLRDLLKMDNPRTTSILTPVFASYNKGLERIEKDFPEFSVVFRKEIPGSGTQAQEREAFKKKVDEAAKDLKQSAPVADKPPAPVAEFMFKVPAAATATASTSSLFGGAAASSPTFSFASGNKTFGTGGPTASTEATSTSSTSVSSGFSFAKPATSFAASQGKPAAETKTTDTVTSTSEAPKPFSFAAAAGVKSTFSFGKKPDAAGNAFGKPNEGSGDAPSAVPPIGLPAAGASSGFSFGKPAAAAPAAADGVGKKDEIAAPKPAFSFGAPAATFSFGSNAGTFGGTSSFGSTGGFTFGPPPASQPAQAGGKDEEEEYEPPVVEQKEIVEEGSFFQAKAKMFYKIQGEFKSKGVGFLFLKKLDSGDVQVLMRADNAAQNVVFNVKAVAGQQVQRLPKNNVLYICVANPPHDPKKPTEVTPVLFRTGKLEEADKLFEELKKAVDAKSS